MLPAWTTALSQATSSNSSPRSIACSTTPGATVSGADQHERLAQVRVELDRYWDLLRQRRAREEFGLDADFVGLRDEDTVERFEQ